VNPPSVFRSWKDESRIEWGRNVPKTGTAPPPEESRMILGCAQRIAEALETIAKFSVHIATELATLNHAVSKLKPPTPAKRKPKPEGGAS